MTNNEERSHRATSAILEEREYQRRRWSTKEDLARPPEYWLGVLTIYLGKAGQEAPVYQGSNYSPERFRKRVTQLGAICHAILECTDTREKSDGGDQGEEEQGY